MIDVPPSFRNLYFVLTHRNKFSIDVIHSNNTFLIQWLGDDSVNS